MTLNIYAAGVAYSINRLRTQHAGSQVIYI